MRAQRGCLDGLVLLVLIGCGQSSGDGGSSGGSAGTSSANAGAGMGATGGNGGSAGSGASSSAAGNGGAASGGDVGTAGNAGNGNAGGESGAGSTPDCVDLSRIEKGTRDLRVVGTGFSVDDGVLVRVVITPRGEPDYGIAETTMENGGFDIELPDAVGQYWGLGVYVDFGRDDACSSDDMEYQMTTGGDTADVTFEVPSSFREPGIPMCSINGIFDMTRVLPCPG
jgi:hypothetical protein